MLLKSCKATNRNLRVTPFLVEKEDISQPFLWNGQQLQTWRWQFSAHPELRNSAMALFANTPLSSLLSFKACKPRISRKDEKCVADISPNLKRLTTFLVGYLARKVPMLYYSHHNDYVIVIIQFSLELCYDYYVRLPSEPGSPQYWQSANGFRSFPTTQLFLFGCDSMQVAVWTLCVGYNVLILKVHQSTGQCWSIP